MDKKFSTVSKPAALPCISPKSPLGSPVTSLVPVWGRDYPVTK